MVVVVTSRHDLTVVLRFVAAIVDVVVHRKVLRLRNTKNIPNLKIGLLKRLKLLKKLKSFGTKRLNLY